MEGDSNGSVTCPTPGVTSLPSPSSSPASGGGLSLRRVILHSDRLLSLPADPRPSHLGALGYLERELTSPVDWWVKPGPAGLGAWAHKHVASRDPVGQKDCFVKLYLQKQLSATQ